MVIPRKGLTKTLITKKGPSRVYRVPKESPYRRIYKKTTVPLISKEENPKIVFYATKIAGLLSPRSFVQMSSVRAPRNWKPKKRGPLILFPKGIEYYSAEVHTSEFHRNYMKAVNKKPDERTPAENKLITDYQRERDVTNKNRRLSKVAERMSKIMKEFERIGFCFDKNPDNLDLVNAVKRPFFFEVSVRNPKRLKRYLNRKKIDGNYTREKKARALKLVDRLISIWEKMEKGKFV